MLKVLILTNKDLTSNIIFSDLFNEKGINVLGVVETGTLTKNKNYLLGSLKLLRKIYFKYWLFLVIKNSIFHLRNLSTYVWKWKYSLKWNARKHSIPFFTCYNFSGNDFLNYVKKLSPDLIVVRVNQILKHELLSVPKYGVWCVHSSLLPSYQGIAGEFHAMARGESTVGSSIFQVKLKLDSGEVIQRSRIQTDHDLLSTIIRNNQVAAKLLTKTVLKLHETGAIQIAEKGEFKQSYFSWPKKDDLILYYKTGSKLVGWVGLRKLLKLLTT